MLLNYSLMLKIFIFRISSFCIKKDSVSNFNENFIIINLFKEQGSQTFDE